MIKKLQLSVKTSKSPNTTLAKANFWLFLGTGSSIISLMIHAQSPFQDFISGFLAGMGIVANVIAACHYALHIQRSKHTSQ